MKSNSDPSTSPRPGVSAVQPPPLAAKPLRIYWTEEQEAVLRWAGKNEPGLSLSAFGQIGLAAMLQYAREVAKRMGQRGENIPPAIAKALDKK